MPKIYKQNCKQCGKYYERPGAKYFCCLHCANINKDRIKKISIANTGKTRSEEFKLRVSELHKGSNNWCWKGNDVGYYALHIWVKKLLGQPKKCEFCGKQNLTGKKIHWANISHEYKRDLADWVRLCVPCHWKYDKIYENRERDFHGRFI